MYIFGDAWPSADVRPEMLAESLQVIRALWGGETVDHRGKHYTVENARLYTLPATAPPVYVSAFGPKAADVAARTRDGLMTVGAQADIRTAYRAAGGTGASHSSVKVAWAAAEEEGLDNAYRLWPNEGLPGELAQVLPTPRHFEQASQLVTRDMIGESVACGPDPGKAHRRDPGARRRGLRRDLRRPDRLRPAGHARLLQPGDPAALRRCVLTGRPQPSDGPPDQGPAALKSSRSATSAGARAGGAAITISAPAGWPRRPVTSRPASAATRPPAAKSHGESPRS